MSERYQCGVPADERQQLDHYKAGEKAFNAMIYVAMAAWVISLVVLRDDTLSIILSVIILAGVIAHERYLEKTGWEEHVQEQIARNPQVRRRAWKGLLIRGLFMSLLWFFSHYEPGEQSVWGDIAFALCFGAMLGAVGWWFEIRRAVRKERNRSASEPEYQEE